MQKPDNASRLPPDRIVLPPSDQPDLILEGDFTVRLRPGRVIIEMSAEPASRTGRNDPMSSDWLYEEPRTAGEYADAITSVFLIDLALHFFIFALSNAGLIPPLVDATRALVPNPISSIVYAPIIEELVYRAVPLWMVRTLTKDETALFVVVLVSSFVFGLQHAGPMAVAVQGVGGVLISAVYLKCGGMRGVFFAPLIAATLYHMLWNTMVIVVVMLLK